MSLKYALLSVLSGKSLTGYELSRKIEGSIAYFWDSTHQQIYKELKNLSEKNLVEGEIIQQTDKPNKKVYSITQSGLNDLKLWLSKEAELPSNKNPLLIKIFSGHLISPHVLLEVLTKEIAKHTKQLEAYYKIEKKHFLNLDEKNEELHYQHLTLRYGILGEEAWLKWATETRKFIEKKCETKTT